MRNRKDGFTLIELLVVIAIIAILASILMPVFAKARDSARKASCQSNERQLVMAIIQYSTDFDETWPTGGWGGFPFDDTSCVNRQWSMNWQNLILPYVKNKQVYKCPNDPWAQSVVSYGINNCYDMYVQWTDPPLWGGIKEASFARPAQTVALVDTWCCSKSDWYAASNPQGMSGPQAQEFNAFVCGDYTAWTQWGRIAIGRGGECGGMGTGTDTWLDFALTPRHSEGNNVAYADGHVKFVRTKPGPNCRGSELKWEQMVPEVSGGTDGGGNACSVWQRQWDW